MKAVYDLSWGDPICVRQALIETLGHKFGSAPRLLEAMSYTPHHGFPHLIEQMRDLAERQSGNRPKYLFVTNGASGSLNAALHALKTPRTDWVVTDKRYYPFIPKMICQADMVMIDRDRKEFLTNKANGCVEENFISLTASPSNPEGLVRPFEATDIFDAAYASKTYSSGGHTPNEYKIMCGSLSKTLGLAGLRLGWVSCNDPNIASSLGHYVSNTYVGLSSVSQGIAEEILQSVDLDRFEHRASGYLDDNREVAQRLLIKFGTGEVPTRGMFFVLPLGKTERKVLDRAGIKFQPGPSWGASDDYARLSLGVSREVMLAAVKKILG
jgi:aspartate/methionine/tyrosine aminotransferase